MARTTTIPPGRSGRMWLRRRIRTAEQGRDQLDRKLRILVPEQQRLRLQEARMRRTWEDACTEAGAWLLRATLLGGQDTLRALVPTAAVGVEIRWTTTTGLRYPSDAALVGPPAAPRGSPGNAAIEPAAACYRAALQAGVRTAAAQEAVRLIDAEILLTRRRLRALEKRWLPWLRDTLAHLELSLEQEEQEDAIRMRRAGVASPDRRTKR